MLKSALVAASSAGSEIAYDVSGPGASSVSFARAVSFRCCLTLGPVPPDLLPGGVEHVLDLPDHLARGGASLSAQDLIAAVEALGALDTPAVVFTTFDLHVNNRISVFGYADPPSGIAVISLYRLGMAAACTQALKTRMENEMAHELGHLNGLAHCSGRCVMNPVSEAAELDTRNLEACGKCPRYVRFATLRKILACAVIGVAAFAANYLLSRVFRPVATPFTCWAVNACGRPSLKASGEHDEISIYFERRKLLTLLDRSGYQSLRDRSLPAVQALNAIANLPRNNSPVLVLHLANGRPALGLAGAHALLEVLPGDTRGTESLESLASKWAEALNISLMDYAYEKRR
jgi:hypothetical protein